MTNDHTPSEIRHLFDRIAPVYDQLNQWLSLGQHRIWKKMAVKWCDLEPGEIGLDLCCGSGDLAELLARDVGTTGQVYGVDFSPTTRDRESQSDFSLSPLNPSLD